MALANAGYGIDKKGKKLLKLKVGLLLLNSSCRYDNVDI